MSGDTKTQISRSFLSIISQAWGDMKETQIMGLGLNSRQYNLCNFDEQTKYKYQNNLVATWLPFVSSLAGIWTPFFVQRGCLRYAGIKGSAIAQLNNDLDYFQQAWIDAGLNDAELVLREQRMVVQEKWSGTRYTDMKCALWLVKA